MIDERLTTVSASALLTQAGVNTKDQKKLIDSAAAVAILESGLAREGR
jgi:putative Holliday junction resolvase